MKIYFEVPVEAHNEYLLDVPADDEPRVKLMSAGQLAAYVDEREAKWRWLKLQEDNILAMSEQCEVVVDG